VHALADGGFENAAFSQHGMEHPDQMKDYLAEQGMVSHTALLICVIS